MTAQQLDHEDVMREYHKLTEMVKHGESLFSAGPSEIRSKLAKLTKKLEEEIKDQNGQFGSHAKIVLKMLEELKEIVTQMIANIDYDRKKEEMLWDDYEAKIKQIDEQIMKQMEAIYEHQKEFMQEMREFFDTFNNQKVLDALKERLNEIMAEINRLIERNKEIDKQMGQNSNKIDGSNEKIQRSRKEVDRLNKDIAVSRKTTCMKHLDTIAASGAISTAQLHTLRSRTEEFDAHGGFAAPGSDEEIAHSYTSHVTHSDPKLRTKLAQYDIQLAEALRRNTAPLHQEVQKHEGIISQHTAVVEACTKENAELAEERRQNNQTVGHLQEEAAGIGSRAKAVRAGAEASSAHQIEEMRGATDAISVQVKRIQSAATPKPATTQAEEDGPGSTLQFD